MDCDIRRTGGAASWRETCDEIRRGEKRVVKIKRGGGERTASEIKKTHRA
jgi:hypothetical protein